MRSVGILFVLAIMGLLALFAGCSSDKMDPVIGPVVPDTVVDTTIISRIDTVVDTTTVILHDTTTITFYDTTTIYRVDTVINTEYDTTVVYRFDTTIVYKVDTVEIPKYIHLHHYDTTFIETPPDTIFDTTIAIPDTVWTECDTVYITSTDTLWMIEGWVIMCCGDGPDGKCECNAGTEEDLGPRAVPECLVDWYLREGWHIAYPGDPCLSAWEAKWCD